jgi:exopolyphosphatase/guanosine-5'-triphosphate,3'-diphosphate pyrophosphatase
MPTIAAIDIGSNAIRMAIGFVNQNGKLQVVDELRESIRLGQDVFTKGTISRETTRKSINVFLHFKKVILQHQVVRVQAYGTSALRESKNRDVFIKKIHQASGIELKFITAEQEALLVYLAVSKAIPLETKRALLIDIGGGSVEISLANKGKILATQSYPIGAVRLLQILEKKKYGEKRFNQMLQAYVESTQKRFLQAFPKVSLDFCIGTGGNLDALSILKGQLLKSRETSFLTLRELNTLIDKLKKYSMEERIVRFRLRPDRADVILPASLVLQKILQISQARRVLIPNLGLKEGILWELVPQILTGTLPQHREELLTSIRATGLKYHYDETHATLVAQLAIKLFDQTQSIHRLNNEYRLLLEAAAHLHDIGQYISYSSHHKHSYYLIRSSQLLGLNPNQIELIALIARYHRKSFPQTKHLEYRALSVKDRLLVSKLAAILRLADAMDNQHESNVQSFSIHYQRPLLSIQLHGTGKMLMERWSLLKKSDLFAKLFKVKISIRN